MDDWGEWIFVAGIWGAFLALWIGVLVVVMLSEAESAQRLEDARKGVKPWRTR